LDSTVYALREQAMQAIAWLVIAYALLRTSGRGGGLVAYWGARILAGLAAGQVVLLQLIAANPLVTGEPVGETAVFNVLLLAYGAPALLALLIAREAERQRELTFATIAGGLATVLLLAWITLEVRRAFHGSTLDQGDPSEAELYAYSAAWLAFGIGLLAAGIWRGIAALRYASLAIVILTVAKVFLVDMAELEGLFRVLSFLGLGLVLVGTGFFYQRFVFPPKPA
jgi:uncharacterized membrane protein